MRARMISFVMILVISNVVSALLLFWFSSRLNTILAKLAGFAGVIRWVVMYD